MSKAAKIVAAIDRCLTNKLGGAFAHELRTLQESAAEIVGLAVLMIAVTAVSEGAALLASAALVGKQVSDVIDLLKSFVRKATTAQDDQTLNAAAKDLAAAIAIAGVNVVLGILLHKAGKSGEQYTKPPPGYVDAVTPEGQIIRVPREVVPEELLSQTRGEGEGDRIPPSEPPPTVRSFSFTTPEVWHFAGRDVVVMNTSQGPQAFYRSTGLAGKSRRYGIQRGEWLPFDGFEGGWFVKDHYFADSSPIRGYGSEEFQQIGRWLKEQNIPTGRDVGEGWGEIQKALQDLGANVRNRYDYD